MPETIVEAQHAPRIMLEALDKLFAKGWTVIAIVEQAFIGELNPPAQHDVGVSDTKNITAAHFSLPHGDHYHDWIIILAQPTADLSNKRLGNDLATVLKLLDMDGQATVLSSGNA